MIDTNVLSELGKPKPAAAVASWWRQQTASDLVLSALVVLELRYGFELLPAGKRRERLEAWLDLKVLPSFHGRILPVDEAVADLSGRLLSAAKKSGHTAEPIDAMIAATAKVHRLAVATLNRKHFERLGVELVEF